MSGNLFADVPTDLPEELVDILATVGGLRIERIVSTGQTSPEQGWYDQSEWEFVVLLAGSATILFEDGTHRELVPGDWLTIEPHSRHRVARTDATQPTVWLAIFTPAEQG